MAEKQIRLQIYNNKSENRTWHHKNVKNGKHGIIITHTKKSPQKIKSTNFRKLSTALKKCFNLTCFPVAAHSATLFCQMKFELKSNMLNAIWSQNRALILNYCADLLFITHDLTIWETQRPIGWAIRLTRESQVWTVGILISYVTSV